MFAVKLLKKSNFFLAISSCLILYFITGTAFSQTKSEFVSGYIISLKNDTTKAEIFYEDWPLSPGTITVKLPGETKPVSLNAFEIKGFGVQTKALKVDFASLKFDIKYIQFPEEVVEFGKSPYSESEQLHAFMKILILGNHASLYRMVDKYSKERFYITKNGQVTELENFSYMAQKGSAGQAYKYNYDNYKSQLVSLCEDAPQMKKATINYYNEESLKNYILKYNQCFAGEVKEVQKTQKTTYSPIVGLGYERTFDNFRIDPAQQKWSNGIPRFYPRIEIGLRANFPYNFRNSYAEIDYNIMALVISGRSFIRGFNLTYGGFFKSKSNFQIGYAAGITEGKNFFFGTGISYKKKISLDIKYGFYPIKDATSLMLKYSVF